MGKWDELVDEKYSDRDVEEENLALMDLTLPNSESESGSGSESDEKDMVYSNLS